MVELKRVFKQFFLKIFWWPPAQFKPETRFTRQITLAGELLIASNRFQYIRHLLCVNQNCSRL